MSVETELKEIINPILAGGCHNGVNNSSAIVLPYAVFYEISAIPENGITQYLGITRYRYQVDVFAATPEQAKGLSLGPVKAVIEASAIIEGVLLSHMLGQYSELDKTFQYITEYQVWV